MVQVSAESVVSGVASMPFPEIWKAILPDRKCVLLARAEGVDQAQTQMYTDILMEHLQLCSCKRLVKDWPFSNIICMEDVLEQVDSDLTGWCALYLSSPSPNQACTFHAIGIGTNKYHQERAGRLALLLASLLGDPRNAAHLTGPGSLLQREIELGRHSSAVTLRPNPRPVDPSEFSSALQHLTTNTTGTMYAPSSVWTPVSGSWVWWYRDCLLVLCDDQSSTLFSEAKSAFQEVIGVDSSQHFEEENVKKCWPELYNAMLRHGLPDIYYAGQFQLEGRRVVGIGRDKEHRKRAACLGMAMVCAGDRHRWRDPKWQCVHNEVFNTSCWFPEGFFNGFRDVRVEQFWQNIESWGCDERFRYDFPLRVEDIERIPSMGAKVVGEILRTCQTALLAELHDLGEYAEIDLTNSRRPWPRIVRGHDKWRDIVGPGIIGCSIAVKKGMLCPYQELPLVHFVVKCVDGTRFTFSDARRTDEELQNICTEQDRRLAFRLAAGWEVRGRWEAFRPCVFVNLIQEFRQQHRSDGWQQDDFLFLPSRCVSDIPFAWTLSDNLRCHFRHWLVHDRQPCPAIASLRRSVSGERSLVQNLNLSIEAILELADESTSNLDQSVGFSAAECSGEIGRPYNGDDVAVLWEFFLFFLILVDFRGLSRIFQFVVFL